MRRWEELRTWWQGRKYKKGIIAGIVCVLVLLVAFIDLLRPGGKLWYALSVQETLKTCELKEGQFCSENKEPEIPTSFPSGTICYSYEPVPSKENFEGDLKFILYGKIEKIRNYVIEGEEMRNGKKIKAVPYYCHVITVQVKRGIYGGVRGNQRVNLLCKWKYVKPQDNNGIWQKIETGKNALFLVRGNAAKIQDGDRSINVLGKITHRRGTSLVETEKYSGMIGLGSKKETIAYYKRHGILY